jgi:uncharacterized protein
VLQRAVFSSAVGGMSDPTTLAEGIEAGIALVGVVLLWQHALSRRARAAARPPALARWNLSPSDFLTFLLFVAVGWVFGGALGTIGIKYAAATNDQKLILASATQQVGILLGLVAYASVYPSRLELPKVEWGKAVRSGVVTFFVAMPVVYVAGFAWVGLLKLCGLPVEKQTAIELFTRTKESGWLAGLVVVAVAMAPIAEELVFRAGLFRYLRTRIPRWAAYVAPACLFSAMHANLASFGQLVALAIVFAAAYERTGQVGTPAVAHALFNLNTVILLLVGINL